jgi:hypothetical protein
MLLRDGAASATSALASPARGAVGPDTPLTARVAEEVLPLRLAQRLPARGVTAVPDETDAIEATDEPAATAPDAEPLDVLSLPKLLPLAVPML